MEHWNAVTQSGNGVTERLTIWETGTTERGFTTGTEDFGEQSRKT